MNDFAQVSGIDWAPGGGHGMVKFGNQGDSNLLVVFYSKAVENTIKSQAAGRRICENHIYITIQHPGESLNKVDRPVTENDKQRFPRQWSAFVQNRTQVPEGTPIDLLFPNHPAVGENLRAMGVFTIEQCAALSAFAIDSIGRGGQEYVNKAQLYIKSADKGKAFHEFQKEKAELMQRIKLLEQQNATMKAQFDAVMNKLENPLAHSLNPPFMPDHDAQAARINANHPTKEISSKSKKAKKILPVIEVPRDPLTDEFATGGVIVGDPDVSNTENQDATI